MTAITGSRCRRSPPTGPGGLGVRSGAVTAGRDTGLSATSTWERHAAVAMAVTAARRSRRPRWPAVAGWGLWGLGTLVFVAAAWVNELLRRAGRPDLAELTLGDTLPLLLASLSSATVGAVLVSRRSRHPVGRLLLGLGLSLITLGLAQDYASLDLLAGDGPLPGAR